MPPAAVGHYWVVWDVERSSEPNRTRRCGLILGAGGILGGCWTIGALRAVEEATGWDARRADMLVGTSVGSLIAAMLAAGVGTSDLVEDQYGKAAAGPLSTAAFDHDTAVDARPRLFPLGSGSPELLARSLLNPLRPSLLAWCTALFPAGWGSLERVHELVEHVVADRWPAPLRIVATDYATGQRRDFGSRDRRRVVVAEAVTASCAMPGCFAPTSIDGRRYVDGAVNSVTNADLIADTELDSVYILAPMAASGFDRPRSPSAWIERGARLTFNRALAHERRILEHAGTRVIVLAPVAEDLATMGVDLMNPRRRIEVMETARVTAKDQLETR